MYRPSPPLPAPVPVPVPVNDLPLQVRTARDTDVPTLLQIVQAAYRGEGGWTTEAHLVRGYRADEAEVRGMLEDPSVLLLVAEEPAARDLPPASTPDGTAPESTGHARLLGCCYTRRDATDPTRAELGLFAVDPSAQGRGVGRFLLEEHASKRASQGVRILELCVLQNRPELRAWYERRGFRATGTTLPFPADPSLLIDPQLRMESMQRPLTGPARP